MISKNEMMEPMLEACPSFRPVWEERLAEWAEEHEPPFYTGLADLARHLIALLGEHREADLLRAFAVVERWHIEGDAFVREAATIGLLESLQNDNLHATTKPAELERFLGPESLRWWTSVAAFWDGRIPYVGADVESSEP